MTKIHDLPEQWHRKAVKIDSSINDADRREASTLRRCAIQLEAAIGDD